MTPHSLRPSATTSRLRRSSLPVRVAALMCLALPAAACADGGGVAVDGPTHVDPEHAAVCALAQEALASVNRAGFTAGTYARIDKFLAAVASLPAHHADLVYQAWQVGDAHRGPTPELTLEPALTNMVDYCAL